MTVRLSIYIGYDVKSILRSAGSPIGGRGMGHGTSDAVMDFVEVGSEEIKFRLGVQFRIPTDSTASESLLAARYLRIQIAWPPPDRVDGSAWSEGLRVRDGSALGGEFDPDDLSWRNLNRGVYPIEGTSPLDQPRPETLVYDGWVTASAVPSTEALGRGFALVPSDKAFDKPLDHFISVAYPTPSIAEQALRLAGVNYYRQAAFPLFRPVHGYIAVCIGVFYPPERRSAEYIVYVDPVDQVAAQQGLTAISTTEEPATRDTVIFPVVPVY